MPTTACFINWNEDPLTRIPCSRAREHGHLHKKGCRCEKCGQTLAQACGDLMRSSRTLSSLLGLPVPALLAESDPKPAALYACWFELRNEFIKEVMAGRIEYPATAEKAQACETKRRRLTNYSLLCPGCKRLVLCVLKMDGESIRECCVECGNVYQVRTVEMLMDLLTLGPDADRLADEALRQRLIRPHAVRGVEYSEPYRQPQRITEFHEGRSHARAMSSRGQAAYRVKN